MRLLALFLILLLLVSGCATHRPAPTKSEISAKRAEALALEDELVIFIRELETEERVLAEAPAPYPSDSQVRALDDRISATRKAKEEVTAQLKEINHEISGPF